MKTQPTNMEETEGTEETAPAKVTPVESGKTEKTEEVISPEAGTKEAPFAKTEQQKDAQDSESLTDTEKVTPQQGETSTVEE